MCPYLLKVKGCRALFDFINKQDIADVQEPNDIFDVVTMD